MKSLNVRRTLIAAGLALASLVTVAPAQQYGSALAVGARLHGRNGSTPVPMDKGDISGVVAFQLHDGADGEGAYWRFGLGYAWEAGRDATLDRILTPQLHLVFHERFFAIGIGVLKSFISNAAGEQDTKIYYDLQAGFEIPVGRFRISALATYPFSDWGKITKFSAQDLEYTAGLAFRF